MQELTQVSEIEVTYRPTIGRKPIIKTALDAFAEVIEFFPPETIALQEDLVVLYLNRANRLLGVYRHSRGTLNGTLVDIRIVLATALKLAASSIVLAHNHPSGNLVPSSADIDLTKKLETAAMFMDIKVLDHLIVSPERKFESVNGAKGVYVST